jgi:hypothetical protein
MKKFFALLVSALLAIGSLSAQTVEELEVIKQAKKDTISQLEMEVKKIQNQIDSATVKETGWEAEVFGTIGFNISNFNNWFQKATPNSAGGTMGLTVNGSVNYEDSIHFWRNASNLNLGWVRFDDRNDPDDDHGYRQATDLFNVSSLYGRKVSQTFAASGRFEFRSSILDNFNDPGYLDVGVGGTWDPAKEIYITVHPLNAGLVFANSESVYESTFGAKVVADYSIKLVSAITFKSNFSGFLSYRTIHRSNWTWTNNFAYTMWKYIGIGLEVGFRQNHQEALNHEIKVIGNEDASFNDVENKLQSYFLMGLSYKF